MPSVLRSAIYMQKQLIFLFCFLALLVSACKFNPNIQGPGTEVAQGIWEEGKVPYEDRLLTSTRHEYKFTCDSFYVTFRTKSKVNIYPDSCYNGGNWTEYVRGTYEQRHDTLYLAGTFTKSNFKQKISGCYRIGQYLNALVLKKSTDSVLVFDDLQQHTPLTLKLKKRIK